MSWSVRVILPNFGVVRMPSRMSGSGRESRPNDQEWFGGQPGCPGVVERHSWMSESGREGVPDVREWSRVPPECL